jgi:hypothetical protein
MARQEEFHHGKGTMPDGSYPINHQYQANAAWKMRGRSQTYSEGEIVHHINARIKELGLEHPVVYKLQRNLNAPR